MGKHQLAVSKSWFTLITKLDTISEKNLCYKNIEADSFIIILETNGEQQIRETNYAYSCRPDAQSCRSGNLIEFGEKVAREDNC